MAQQTQQACGYYTGSYSMDEDRAIYGLGSNRDMPSLCPNCKGNPRDRVHCNRCGATGMLGVPGISADDGRRDRGQTSGGPSSGRGNSRGDSSVFRGSRR
ncbi:uncharacterized protein F4807DRAFT_465163 [Annulohypoxylon truncatum]|uniref:uncharacterized protein n=1 Tax=Annulohypoxylon truncatum TaxID=327061 RepID=UPI002007A68C|nr:uncharacterized protein F4807DRAFT_465163 [Annulohypoxylon truncatum]KAI1204926.1 hypothetical protein F4807DRAFT_465163 [Annulohypoxylon truncatum]